MSSVTKHQRYREQSAEHGREHVREHGREHHREHGRHHLGPTSAGTVRTTVGRSHSARRVARPEVVGSSLDVPRRSPRDDVRSADATGRRSPTAFRASPTPPPAPPPPPPPSSPMLARSRWTNVADKFNASRRRSVCNGSQPSRVPPPILVRERRHSVAGVSPSLDQRQGELTQSETGSLSEVAPPKNKIPFPRMGSQTFMEVLQGFQEELQLSNELSQSERDAEEATDTRRRVHFRYDVRLE